MKRRMKVAYDYLNVAKRVKSKAFADRLAGIPADDLTKVRAFIADLAKHFRVKPAVKFGHGRASSCRGSWLIKLTGYPTFYVVVHEYAHAVHALRDWRRLDQPHGKEFCAILNEIIAYLKTGRVKLPRRSRLW